jgi:hypothetical protein
MPSRQRVVGLGDRQSGANDPFTVPQPIFSFLLSDLFLRFFSHPVSSNATARTRFPFSL